MEIPFSERRRPRVIFDEKVWRHPVGSFAPSARGRSLTEPLPAGVEPYQLELFPRAAYQRLLHYGATPLRRSALSPPGMEFDHNQAVRAAVAEEVERALGPTIGPSAGYPMSSASWPGNATAQRETRLAAVDVQRVNGQHAAILPNSKRGKRSASSRAVASSRRP